MSDFTRREFLKSIGASGATASLTTLAIPSEAPAFGFWFTTVLTPNLPIYRATQSWLATGLNGVGRKVPASTTAELDQYEVTDDVIVPPKYERCIIVQWGDQVFPEKDDYFGVNNDHTGYVPIVGSREGVLVVNHEYSSYPFDQLSPGAKLGFGNNDPSALKRTLEAATWLGLPDASSIFDLKPEQERKLYSEQCYNLGMSVIRAKRDELRGRRIRPEKGGRS